MIFLLTAVGITWILVVGLLVLVLLTEVLAGRRPTRDLPPAGPRPPPYVVLMPAHDEGGTIHPFATAVRAQLPADSRLLVVADNCSDSTAAQARAAGAEVVERHNPLLRGKGHALAFGVEHLRSAPPPVLVILDADCMAAPGALDLLAAQSAQLDAPVQGLYLMRAKPNSPLRVRMAAFAWALRNQVRPLGLHRLGQPCQLMGSGMAFPWHCISKLELGSGHLTEDLELGARLAAAGYAPRFCPQAQVESWFPEDGGALDSQRRRWEHGHLSMLLTAVPALVWRALRTGRVAPLALGLDLCVPPLALLALLVLVSCGFGAAIALGQAAWPAAGAAAALTALAFAAAVLLAWRAVGRQWVSLLELASAPAYVVKKLPLYLSFVVRRQREWVRTGRQR